MNLGCVIAYVPEVSSRLTMFDRVFGLSRRFPHEFGVYGELYMGETIPAFEPLELGNANRPSGLSPQACWRNHLALKSRSLRRPLGRLTRKRCLATPEVKFSEPKPCARVVPYIRNGPRLRHPVSDPLATLPSVTHNTPRFLWWAPRTASLPRRFVIAGFLALLLLMEPSYSQNVLIPPIMRGMYNDCRVECADQVKAGTIKDGPKASESADEKGGFCRFVCACIFEKPTVGIFTDAKKRVEAQAACVEQYKYGSKGRPAGPTNAGTALTAHAVKNVGAYSYRPLPSSASRDEVVRVREHMDGMRQTPVLECKYESKGFRFWYERVPMSRERLVEVSQHHPLLIFGSEALMLCPKTLGEAERRLEAIGGRRN